MELNIIKNRYLYFGISIVLLLVSLFTFIFGNLNYWIDMTWGTQAEYEYSLDTLNLEEIKAKLLNESENLKYNEKEVINSISVIKISGENKLSIVTGYNQISVIDNKDSEENLEKLSWDILSNLKSDFRNTTLETLKTFDKDIIEDSYTNIWKSFWDYIKNTAITTLIIAIIAISVYVMYAFWWIASGISIMSFAVITIMTLFHDVLISLWLYIITSIFLPEFKIDTFFITALLTILGYSINDTIVVFDKIRWNIKKSIKKKSLTEIIEISVSETLRRSIFTSLTLFFVLLTIFFFWPETIKGFILAMLFGTIIGTYSSIFIASPLLYEFNKNKKLSEYKEKVIKPEDKIVV